MTTPDSPVPNAESTQPFQLLTVASSAGGVRALVQLIAGLPGDFPVPVVIVQHLDPRHQTVIAEVLGRHSEMPVKLAEHEEKAKPGTVYVAPPNRHLFIGADSVLTLADGELVHFVRPSADLLFEAAAGAYGALTIGCVLTGSGGDGAMGVRAIKARGGTVVVEDPDLAEFRGMPDAAVNAAAVDFVLPLAEIAPVLCRLVRAGRS
jgi:two-component system, chemotaxis family, protein-glutamate methylesterase/glutaminase